MAVSAQTLSVSILSNSFPPLCTPCHQGTDDMSALSYMSPLSSDAEQHEDSQNSLFFQHRLRIASGRTPTVANLPCARNTPAYGRW